MAMEKVFMKLLIENWRKFINEQKEIAIDLPRDSSVRYNIQSGGDLSVLDRIPHPFSRKYKFIQSSDLPSIFYFGGPAGMDIKDVTVDARSGGIGAKKTREQEAGFYVTKYIEDAQDYADKNENGELYKVTLSPSAGVYSYPGRMDDGRSWIVNFSQKDWNTFTKAGADALYDPISGYLIVLNKNVISSFEPAGEKNETPT